MRVSFGRCRTVTTVLASAVFAAFGASSAHADILAFTAPTLTSPVDYQSGIPVVLGNVFTANVNFSVDALGIYYNPSLLTLTGSEDVGLYNSSHTLLASVTVPDTGTPIGSYLFASITPLTLTAGQTYTVAAQVGDNPWAYGPPSPGAPPTASQITFQYDDYCYGSTLQFPCNAGGSGPAYYGPNLEIAPEPGFYATLAIGLSGLALFRRRRRNI